MDSINARIAQLISLVKLNKVFSEKTGIDQKKVSYIKNSGKPINSDILEQILKSEAFSQISADWLLLGEGPMYRNELTDEEVASFLAEEAHEYLRMEETQHNERSENEILRQQLSDYVDETERLRKEIATLKVELKRAKGEPPSKPRARLK